MKIARFLLACLLLLVLASCGPRSLEDYREEGEGVTRSLIQELQSIQTRDQLISSSHRLQKLFDRLVTVMIEAQEFSQSHPNQDKETLMKHNHELSDQLRIELNRLYRLEGGRQIIEKCQEAALHRLDAFEKKQIKKKN